MGDRFERLLEVHKSHREWLLVATTTTNLLLTRFKRNDFWLQTFARLVHRAMRPLASYQITMSLFEIGGFYNMEYPKPVLFYNTYDRRCTY